MTWVTRAEPGPTWVCFADELEARFSPRVLRVVSDGASLQSSCPESLTLPISVCLWLFLEAPPAFSDFPRHKYSEMDKEIQMPFSMPNWYRREHGGATWKGVVVRKMLGLP